MQIFRALIISTLLTTSISCTDGNVRSVPLEKAPFMEFQVDYEGQTLTLSLDEKNEKQTKLLPCETLENDLFTEYCELNKIDYDTTAIWKLNGVVKQARFIFPLSDDVAVDMQVREILSVYGLTLEDFHVNSIGKPQATYDGAVAWTYLPHSSSNLQLNFSTLPEFFNDQYVSPEGKGTPYFGYAVGQTLTEYDLRILDCEKDPLSVHQSIHRCEIETDLSNTLYLTLVDNVIFSASMSVFFRKEQAKALTDSFFEQAGGREKLDELALKEGSDFVFRAEPVRGNQAMLHVEMEEDSSYQSVHFIYATQDNVDKYIESL